MRATEALSKAGSEVRRRTVVPGFASSSHARQGQACLQAAQERAARFQFAAIAGTTFPFRVAQSMEENVVRPQFPAVSRVDSPD